MKEQTMYATAALYDDEKLRGVVVFPLTVTVSRKSYRILRYAGSDPKMADQFFRLISHRTMIPFDTNDVLYETEEAALEAFRAEQVQKLKKLRDEEADIRATIRIVSEQIEAGDERVRATNEDRTVNFDQGEE